MSCWSSSSSISSSSSVYSSSVGLSSSSVSTVTVCLGWMWWGLFLNRGLTPSFVYCPALMAFMVAFVMTYKSIIYLKISTYYYCAVEWKSSRGKYNNIKLTLAFSPGSKLACVMIVSFMTSCMINVTYNQSSDIRLHILVLFIFKN
jgi:hypothetical protein